MCLKARYVARARCIQIHTRMSCVSINELTCLVFRTHQESLQKITGKTTHNANCHERTSCSLVIAANETLQVINRAFSDNHQSLTLLAISICPMAQQLWTQANWLSDVVCKGDHKGALDMAKWQRLCSNGISQLPWRYPSQRSCHGSQE